MKASTAFKASAGVLAALIVAGIAAWIHQLINGLGIVGMGSSASWGLCIACFMLFVELPVGGLVVASSARVCAAA